MKYEDIENFPIMYHSRMISDEYRLNAFRSAIEHSILEDSKVVDLGGGTGIITKMIINKTKKKVAYIDLLKDSMSVSKILNNNINRYIDYINDISFNVNLKDIYDVLITETIGYLGIDEGIVEICSDFVRRHQNIKKIIPSKISLKYQLLNIPEIEDEFNILLKCYQNNFEDIPNNLIENFEILFCNIIRKKYIESKHIDIHSQEILINEFNLGVDKNSEIDYNFEISSNEKANIIHLYFNAELHEDINLTNYIFKPKTHWQHVFVKIPNILKGRKFANLKYTPKIKKFKLKWI